MSLETYSKLTDREKECLGLISDGLTRLEIAKKMGNAIQTTDQFLASIRRKLGIKSFVLLARFYDKYLRKYNDNSAV